MFSKTIFSSEMAIYQNQNISVDWKNQLKETIKNKVFK